VGTAQYDHYRQVMGNAKNSFGTFKMTFIYKFPFGQVAGKTLLIHVYYYCKLSLS